MGRSETSNSQDLVQGFDFPTDTSHEGEEYTVAQQAARLKSCAVPAEIRFAEEDKAAYARAMAARRGEVAVSAVQK